MALASSIRVLHFWRSSSSICMEDQKLSIMALSSPSPIDPKDGISPGGADLFAENPRGELGSVIGMNDAAGGRAPVADGHI